ncbi:hypothetical protein LTS18_005593 [Coniosporium uncinatum]|uniref:Uncharacterized protein n=1 Tax=Coniosporium uncinatum TaxID=93489 RepID=A0ACC3DRK7_9PEZI|nr:hypothetical protein LTS18_005593 [Coniosporium uncinatum]
MDKLKDMANKASGGGSGGASNAGGNQDYGLDAVEKKMGMPQNRQANEKITDSARDAFEKGTGKNVPDKFSN